jgi:ABC-type multidrug transport system fused ATPase/permease subunit
MRTFGFIYKNLDRFKTRFFFVLLAGFFDGLATFFIPVLLAEFTKTEFTAENFRSLISYIVGFYILSLFLQFAMRKYGEALGPQFGNHIRLKYFQALEKLSVQNLTVHHSGYLLSLINKVSDGMAPLVFDIFWTFAKGAANMTLFFYFTARESFPIAVFNIIVLSIFVAISTYLSGKMVPLAEQLNLKKASLLESYADFMSNILTVKKLGIHAFAEGKLLGKTEENYRHIQKLQNFHAHRWFFLHALFGGAFLSTIGFLLLQISKGSVSVSVLILFIAAYAVIRGNIERLSENLKALMEMGAYIRDLDDVVAPDKLLARSGGRTAEGWREIRFAGVEFEYPGTNKKIGIPDFYIRKGEKICVIGRSGEGKTTFLNLFADFLTVGGGERSIDGQPYDKVNKKFFQDGMALISQETELFNVSLLENLTIGRKEKAGRVSEVLEQLDLGAWAKNLPEGLDTIVGEKGAKLSAGQKQRINLARGVLLDREILLLDEPTAHLDATTEGQATDFLKKYLEGKTAIIISHREALISICDRCYIVEGHVLKER